MWRQTDDRKVWYEWIVEVFSSTQPLQDTVNSSIPSQGKEKGKGKGKEKEGQGGGGSVGKDATRNKRTRIAISELHSSVKDACLM